MKIIQKMLNDHGFEFSVSFVSEIPASERSKSNIVGENPVSNSELPNEETRPIMAPMVTLTSALKNWPT
jgi:hypothetical protein